MSSTSAWATSAREEMRKHPANTDHMNEGLHSIDVIEDLLTGGQSALRAGRRIACIYEPRLKTGQRDGAAILWATICEAANSIDESAAVKLAGLVIAIRNQPDVLCPSGEAAKHGDLVYWRDLPRWDPMFRDYGYEIDPPTGNDAEWHAQAPELLKITIFAATLMVRADGNPNVSFAASHAMYNGADRPYDDTREVKEEWRMYIPPAATWILIAGSKIRDLCFMDELPEAANNHTIRSKWGGRAYCPERWQFWKQRFEQLAEDVLIGDRCQEYAKQAFEAMNQLEA
ncbi:hypothetical protein E4T49_03311 [Aureobasidium sp. EXF-10728]|nr:hypothetical protein E4T49_03311 [Aureobasidium sp. EXF-10728]